MKKDLTVKELIESINNALKKLKGKDVTKVKGGISELVSMVIDSIDINLSDYDITHQYCLLQSHAFGIDTDVEFAAVMTQYKADKRMRDGFGNHIEDVKFELTREIPDDLEIIDLPQYLAYEVAKERFESLKKEQGELLKQYTENIRKMLHMQEFMEVNAYDNKCKGESDKAKNTIYELEIKLKEV